MARLPRLALAGLPHHLIVRSLGGRPLFIDEHDCIAFLELLTSSCAENAVSLHAYVLLPAQVQLLQTPAEPQGLGRLVQDVARRYVRRFNQRHQQSGSLFEARYRSAVVQPGWHLLASMRHIERQPLGADLVSDPAEYRWSSYCHHAGLANDPLIRDHASYWALGNTPFDRHAAYTQLVLQSPDMDEQRAITKAVEGGWAIGEETFLAEVAVWRPSAPRRAGRPRSN